MTRKAKPQITVTHMTSDASSSSFLISGLPRGCVRELKKRFKEQGALMDAIMVYQRSQNQLNIDPGLSIRGIKAAKVHEKIIRSVRKILGGSHSVYRDTWYSSEGFDAPAY